MKDRYLAKAVREYEEGIQSGKPFYMDALMLLDVRDYYVHENRPFDAEQCLRVALRLHPDNEEVLVEKAYDMRAKGQRSEAERLVKSLPDQDNREVQLFYIETAVAGGDLEGADLLYRRKQDNMYGDEANDWKVDYGEILLDYGYAARAAQCLRSVPADYRDAKHYLELLADAEDLAGNKDEGERAANRLIDTDPYDVVSWCQLAELQQRKCAYEDCLKSCDYALAIDPQALQAMSMKVFSLYALKRDDEAFACAREYIKAQPEDYTIPMYVGENLCTQIAAEKPGKRKSELTELSHTYLSMALSRCPLEEADHTRISNGVAHTLCWLSMPAKAEEQMLSSLAAGMSRYEAHLQLAEWMLDAAETDGMVQQLKKAYACRAAGGDPDGYSIACWLHEKGQYVLMDEVWRLFAPPAEGFVHKDMYAILAVAMFLLQDLKTFSFYFKAAETQCYFDLMRLFYEEVPGVEPSAMPEFLKGLSKLLDEAFGEE